MSPVCKTADIGRLTVDQKVKVVLFYAETKSVVPTQRSFRAHVDTRWAPCKQTIYSLSLGTIFQPMRINSVPDIKCFCKNKNVLCVQWMVWHFVRHLEHAYCFPAPTYMLLVTPHRLTKNNVALLASMLRSLYTENRIEWTVLDKLPCISDAARFSLYVKIRSRSIGLFLFRTSPFPSHPTSHSGIT